MALALAHFGHLPAPHRSLPNIQHIQHTQGWRPDQGSLGLAAILLFLPRLQTYKYTVCSTQE
jgi:hypothetical protein